MMNWDHLQDLSKDDLIARVILGEWQQVNWERAYNEMKQRAEAAERKAEEAARDAERLRQREETFRGLVADDAYASCFQSLGQYRTSILGWIDERNDIDSDAAIAAKGEA